MQSRMKLSTLFSNGLAKSFLHIKADEKKGGAGFQSKIQQVQEDLDAQDVRIKRGFVAPKPFTVLKRLGTLFTQKQNTSIFACFSSKRKPDDVELLNRKLTVRRKGEATININFNTLKATIQEQSDGINLVVYANQTKNVMKFYFERAQGEDIEEWRGDIVKAIAGSEGEKYPLTYLSAMPEYWKTDSITEDDFTKTCDTGDILLFRSSHNMAVIQRGITASEYDHVGVIIRNQKNELIILQSNTNTGVAVSLWKDMIRYRWYEAVEKITYRKLEINRTEFMITQAENFVVNNIDKEFKIDVGKLFTFTSSLNPSEEQKKNRTYFCSELVAAFYKSMGLIPKETSCTQYFPVHFSQGKNLGLLEGELGPEQIICFDVEPISKKYK